jgi:hypothetical protein
MGYIGVGPMAMKDDDIMRLGFGCRARLVLRREANGAYVLVSEWASRPQRTFGQRKWTSLLCNKRVKRNIVEFNGVL